MTYIVYQRKTQTHNNDSLTCKGGVYFILEFRTTSRSDMLQNPCLEIGEWTSISGMHGIDDEVFHHIDERDVVENGPSNDMSFFLIEIKKENREPTYKLMFQISKLK